jgi:hypothetical protein
MHTSQMVSTNPTPPVLRTEHLVDCIEACFDCAQACSACADACLGEDDIAMLRRCIRLNEDCAGVCLTTGQMLSRQQHSETRLMRSQLETCLLACQLCGDECARHASHHEHCRICEEACRTCAKACRDALSEMGGLVQPASA